MNFIVDCAIGFMSVKIHNKLVRDNIPDVISSRGHTPFVRVLGADDFLVALKHKLLEEAHEAVAASSSMDLLAELADLNEVVEALTRHAGFSISDLEAVQAQKRVIRGGFEKKIFLEKVDEN